MRLNTRSTRARRRGERAQAIVIVAMIVVVLIGFIGLAIDGGRLYWERRILQNSVDAAALAASDNYQDSLSISASYTAAAKEYAANEKIYGTASASPSWTAATVDITWTGSSDTMHVVYTSAGSVSAFDVSSTHTIQLAFMSVLGAGASATVKGLAEGHAKTGGTSTYALVTLGTTGCPGAGQSLKIFGAGAQLVVQNGNVQINGAVSAAGNGASVNGNFADNCTNPVPANVTATGTRTAGVAPVSDPGFSSGNLASYSSVQAAGVNIVLSPGVYSADPSAGGSSCYFMAPGIYQLNGGVNDAATTLSNELKPPDEPAWQGSPTNAPNYNNSVASPQFWPSGCTGSFSVAAAPAALALATGNWGAVVTSTRTETYPVSGGTSYPRESAPSTCHWTSVGAAQGVKVTINNVPGAQGYNIYLAYSAAGNPCATGPWGYVGHVVNSVTETTASMGTVTSPVYDTSVVSLVLTPANVGRACTPGAAYAFGCAAATGSFGSANPPGDGAETAPQYTGGPPWVPARDIVSDGGGDRANEHDCNQSTSTNPAAPCTNVTVTPGAVQVYFPSGACLVSTGGLLAWFGGFQFNNIAIYAPPANNCSPNMSGHANFGTSAIYWPQGNWTLTGNSEQPIASEVIVNTLTVQGNGTLTISYDQQTAPVQGYSQLSL